MKKKRNKPSPPLPLPSSSPSPSDKNQSTSTNSSSSFSSFASFSSVASSFSSPSPAPSPYHFSYSVPFSWERKPGVPFTPLHPHFPSPRFPSSHPLPLPPSKVKSLDGSLATIQRRRRGLEIFLSLIGRLVGLDPYCSCKPVSVDDVENREAKKTSWTSRKRHWR